MMRLTLMLALAVSGSSSLLARDVPPVIEAIRNEVTKKNTDPGGRPLPAVSHWANGFDRPTFSSEYQIELLEAGHHIIPTIPFPRPGASKYTEAARPWVDKLARWKAPISLRAGQWESVLYSKDHPQSDPGRWRRLPPEKSPLVIDLEGNVAPRISPWGATEPWYEAGVYNTRSGAFRQLQEWYSDPPFLILLSNNEANILKPKHDIEKLSKRYMDAHGPGRPRTYLRRAMAEGYLERYARLLKGIRDGLENPSWRRNSLLVGYGGFGPSHFGRWPEWTRYSYTSENRIDYWHRVWEGGSPSYYTHNWNASTDYRVHSPQVEANNWVFMLEEAYRENPDFWFEISVWDGNPSRSSGSRQVRKMDSYLAAGQIWSSGRYAGFVKYGLWLLRPRVVREFRGSTVPRAEFKKDFEALVTAVDEIWENPVLTRFWRDSRLVPNRAHKHPYQSNIPEKWKDVDRWFVLETSLDRPRPWTLETELPVFSLARVRGEKPDREWLVYAHAPVKARRDVGITIPGFHDITVEVTPEGDYYRILETTNAVMRVKAPPAPPRSPGYRSSPNPQRPAR